LKLNFIGKKEGLWIEYPGQYMLTALQNLFLCLRVHRSHACFYMYVSLASLLVFPLDLCLKASSTLLFSFFLPSYSMQIKVIMWGPGDKSEILVNFEGY
jgi:hypothetical protein